MTPIDFVSMLRSAVVEDNAAIYKDLFLNTKIEAASDNYWKRALNFFGALTPDQQQIFFEILRQVAVDTTSNILGVIDGVNSFDGFDGEFVLMYDDDAEPLSGDLQSLFLAEEEAGLKQ